MIKVSFKQEEQILVEGNTDKKEERIDCMAVALKEDYQRALDEQKKSPRACNGWIGTDKRGKDKRLLYCV